MRAKGRRRSQLLCIVALATVPNVVLGSSTWTYAPGGGNWTASWNDTTIVKPWSPNSPFPNGSTAAVVFPAVYGAGQTPVITAGPGTVVLSGQGVTVNQISFFGSATNTLTNPATLGGFNITGTGSITLAPSMSTGVATLDVGSAGRVGTTTIPGIATISVSLSESSGTLYKTGAGTLVLSGSNLFSGSSGLQINSGTLRITSTDALTGLGVMATANDGQLELQNASSSGTIWFGAGSSTIRPEGVLYNSAGNNVWSGLWLLIHAGQTIGVASNSSLTHNGDFFDGTSAGATGLTKTGGGTLAVGAIVLVNPPTIAAGTFKTTPGSGTATDIPGLTIAGGAAPTAKWDLTDNKLVIRSGNQPTITSYLTAGFNGGAWSGNGITSSTAQADAAAHDGLTVTGIGMARGDQLPDWNGASSHFGALTLAASDLALMYTATGDTNLDGVVDADADFTHYVAGLTAAALSPLVTPDVVASGADWFHGDFNFDGAVDINHDFALFVAGYEHSGSSLDALANAIDNASGLTSTQRQQMFQMIPEPSLTGLSLVLLAGSARRRRTAR